MLKSMTGYGRAQKVFDQCTVTAELRSVNHRYFDCSVRIPRLYIFMEEPIKARVQKSVGRGKVDVFISVEYDESAASQIEIKFNRAVAEGYIEALKRMRGLDEVLGDISLMELARLPEVFSTEKKELDADKLLGDILLTLDEAIASYMDMCGTEGEALKTDILERASTIENAVARIEKRSPEAVREYRDKLLTRMKEVLADTTIDESRILSEAALYADKTAVNEELVRLLSHISQLRGMLKSGGAVGRKLDFLVQEFNREANTIGSKANDIDILKEVVDLKAEIEKIREQIQNIE